MPSKPKPTPKPGKPKHPEMKKAPLPLNKDDLKKLKKAPPVMKKGDTKKLGRGY